ncbi:NADH dehydrogenase 1 alpha subcomplex subunit 6 ndufa6 [Gaertneriomyces sp. JEL0708]|nr:NADH dehydrogenase 1 alpha subcomplex subunit 6 ndufa6 [Gaertneriomyces sp. JEL0708]
MTLINTLPTVVSRNAKEQRSRVIQLFRDCVRAAPDIVEMYRLHFPVWKVRQRMREEFEKNAHVSDPQVVDILLFKGRNELVETLQQWKQDDHILRFFPNNTYDQPERKIRPFEDENGRGKVSDFLADFYEGNEAGARSRDYA